MTPEDPRAEPPEQPKTGAMPPQPPTVSLPVITDRALLEDLGRVVRNMADNVGTMSHNVSILMEDRPVLHSRLAGVEGRLARIESPTTPPPPPLTSTRVQAIIDKYPSQMDLESKAKIDDFTAWQSTVATKSDLTKTTVAQTEAIVKQVNTWASGPTAKIVGTLIFGIVTGYAASKGWIVK